MPTNKSENGPQISIGSLQERDIDLVVAQELACSPAFRRWFVAAVFGRRIPIRRWISTRVSVDQPTGESDIEARFESRGRILALFMENKIHASFQPDQAKRYAGRAKQARRRGVAQARTVLLCPSHYLGRRSRHPGFDVTVAYEQMLAWFCRGARSDARAAFVSHLLQSAIDRSRLGYQPEEDAPTTRFWREYWEASIRIAPELQMAEPSGRPSGSTFVYFQPDGMPKSIRLVHKLRHGFADLQFEGMATRISQVRDRFGRRLEAGMMITPAGRSCAVRLKIPPLDTTAPFARQLG